DPLCRTPARRRGPDDQGRREGRRRPGRHVCPRPRRGAEAAPHRRLMSSFEQHQEYAEPGLGDDALGPDPLVALRSWLADAEAAGLPDPNAMVVGTVEPDGRPSSRTVLWKGVTDGALAFFTNRDSHKGAAIAHEARVSLL